MLINGVEIYKGMELSGNPVKSEKIIRKALGLPDKKLVIYKGPLWKKVWVDEMVVAEVFPEYVVLEVNGVKIHHAMLAEMQKPSFEKCLR